MNNLKVFAEKLAEEYKTITGINCTVIDINDKTANESFFQNGFCSVCRSLRKSVFDKKLDCLGMMSYSCLQSEQWGGKYESLCPMSLAFISTIVYNAKEKLGICFGPFLMMEIDDFISEDISSHFDENVRPMVLEAVKQIPYIEISKVSAYSDMLYMAACYVAERNSLEISLMEQISGNSKQQFDYILDAKERSLTDYPIHTERMLQSYISQGDKKSAQSALNKLVSQIFLNAGGDIDTIKVRVTELLVLLSRAAIDGGADIMHVFGMNQDYISTLYEKKSLGELNKWLSEVLIRFSNSVFDIGSIEHSDIIMTIVGYIRENYMRKISLNDISSSVGLSVSYISRIFKREMGSNITAFINKVRVDNAKILLLNHDVPIVEVAYLCGFEDQTYFTKVFKKMTNVSPGKFREKRGKLI